ncbi:MAG: thymidine phosphorylase [Gammaproteobacteria bacterium]
MVEKRVGISWEDNERVFDNHCTGGVPGNRTTPIVVAIASAAGLVIPKTLSRAITSPAGTADTLDALFDVQFEISEMKRIVSEVGACLVWGGAIDVGLADDVMNRIERALNLDREGQLVASVLSRKIAAGSTHVVIDMPVGKTAKVKTGPEANRLAGLFARVGKACGIEVRCVFTEGSQPVGSGIGPVQEAIDVLAVLKLDEDAPIDLREKALLLSANLIDMAASCGIETATEKTRDILDSGLAWKQFQKIADAQGGMKDLEEPTYASIQASPEGGNVKAIDNRRLTRLAKLAGAPVDKVAGLRLYVSVGETVNPGDPLFTLFSASSGELKYALDYYDQNNDLIVIG